MGYRSTMILGIPPKQKEEFEKILKKHYGEDNKLFELVKEEDDMLILLNKAHNKDEDSSFLVGIAEDGVIHSEIGHYYDYVGISTTHEIY